MATYDGRVALVTGSRRGVGKVIADHFLAEGATVIGFARGESTCAHDRYHHYQVDVSQPAEIQRIFIDVRKSFATIDILVNNAASLTSQYAMIMAVSSAQEMVNVNLLAPFLISRECAKMMRKAKWGRIINIGSMAASLEPVGDSVYAATKAGLSTLNNVMAKEFSSFNVTCNTLGISAIETDMLAQLPREKVDAIIAGLPVPRYAHADDVLNVIDFFASTRSACITAQTVYLGGVH